MANNPYYKLPSGIKSIQDVADAMPHPRGLAFLYVFLSDFYRRSSDKGLCIELLRDALKLLDIEITCLKFHMPYPPVSLTHGHISGEPIDLKSKVGYKEAKDVAQIMNYNCGTAFTYLWRADKKHPTPLDDLQKAADHINYEIEYLVKLSEFDSL